MPSPINRWLAERPEDAPWNNIGFVFGTYQDNRGGGNADKKSSSNVAVYGSNENGGRYKL
jgi:hypothetical protein